jgi:hypothetical protein
VRTNYCTNPSFEVDLTGWTAGGPLTAARDTTVRVGGIASVKLTRTGAGAVSYRPIGTSPATPGQVWTISFYSTTSSTSLSGGSYLTFFNSVGADIGDTFIPVPAGTTFTRQSATVVAPSGTASVVWQFYTSNGVNGDSWWLDQVLLEPTSKLLPYFDGDTINCQWAGTPGASTSTWFSQGGSLARRNLSTNPRGATGVGFGLNNVYWSAAYNQGVVGHPLGVSTAVLVTVTDSVHAGNQIASMFNLDTLGDYKAPRLVGAWVWSSVGGSALIYCGTGAWTTVPVPATTWTFVQMSTASPGQCVLVVTKGSGNTVNGDYCFMTAVVSDPSGATLPYFDGDSVNSAWDGAAGSSTSQQILPLGLNPNQPMMEWRVWTGENPPAVPNTPTTKPLLLSDRARSFKIERGRQYELDQDQAGTASVVLDNNDGTVIAGKNNMYPMRLGQLRVTYLGQTYTLYTGYVSTWPDKASDPATSQSELTFVDLMDPMANKPLLPMYQNEMQSMVPPPDYLWPFGEAAGSGSTADVMGSNVDPIYPVVGYKGGDPGTLAFGGAGLCHNDSSTSLTNTGGTAGKASQVQLSGPVAGRTIQVDTTKPWFATMLLKATSGASTVFSILDNNGAVFASLSFNASTATVSWYVGGATQSWVTGDLAGGVNVGIGFNGTNALWGYSGAYGTVGGYVARGVCSWIAAGACFSGTQIFNGSVGTYWLQYLSLWSNGAIPSLAYPGPFSDAYYAFITAYGNIYRSGQTTYDTTTTRLTRFLKWAGQGGLAGDSYGSDAAPYYNTGWLSNLPDTKGSAPLDLIRQAALNVWGRFFISKSGLPTFHSKDHGQTLTAPSYVFGSTELPYTGSPGFEYDVVHVYNDVQISLPGDSLPSPYWAGAFQKNAIYRWVNKTSIGKYFTRVLQAASQLLEGGEAAYLSQWLANKYGEPDYRIGEITLDPIGNPALWPAVLNLELDDLVQVNHRDLNGTRSGLFQVSKIRHEVDGGDVWNTVLSLTPFHQYWLLAAMHTTFAASCLAGATSISLNPLPDSATNPAEASLGVGTTITLDPGTANAETVTIKSVTSAPTANTTGYTSITLGVTATAHAHAAGAVACDPLPSGVTDPTTWDARSVLGTTTVLNA